MPAGAHLLIDPAMAYVTFVSRGYSWRLHRGIGPGGAVVTERVEPEPVSEVSGARQPILWLGRQRGTAHEAAVQRLSLVDLNARSIAWDGGRLGALASSPDGEQAMAVELPDEPDQRPALRLWRANRWSAVAADPGPDISSKVAWLDDARIVYESNRRRLTLLDLGTGGVEVGPPGSYPAAATTLGEWYAVSAGQVLRFPLEGPFRQPPARLDAFRFGHVTTLRVTHDGHVCTWTQPRFLYRSKAYFQERGRWRRRFREADDGLGAVLGPYALG